MEDRRDPRDSPVPCADRAPALTPGEPARAVFTKYDGRPHWEFDLTVLGEDEYGVWLGGGIGDIFARPGLQMQSTAHYVCLFPAQGWYVATFNDHGAAVRSRIYIDVATEPRWTCPAGEPQFSGPGTVGPVTGWGGSIVTLALCGLAAVIGDFLHNRS